MIKEETYRQIIDELKEKAVLVAVSKIQSISKIQALYNLGQRDFGENYVQELVEKYNTLPKDIKWHFIGHLQSNKVKYIAPFVDLIHGVDSMNLLKEINKEANKNNRIIDCLLQVHIASEETKFGMNEEEVNLTITEFEKEPLRFICIKGLMGMASFTDDQKKIRHEFRELRKVFEEQKKKALSNVNFQLSTLSMGMSADYKIALEEGSNMVRIGSLLFGKRN
ncbi:YggS family pyridoxal phosphate-dependent enzyme [soil metagenome]